jgi:hypothetical protein
MRAGLAALLIALASAVGCMAGDAQPAGSAAPDPQRLFIIGQDLGSVRDYVASGCCPAPDGNTAYLSFYDLLSEEAGLGGLGIDPDGSPVDREFDWGGGPANAWKSATEFEGGLAIGLSITENHHPGALDRLVAGEYDANIRQLARFIGRADGTVWLRVGYEFDGTWNVGYENQERYIAAYRRIVDGLRAAGVDNTEYVWQSAASPLTDLDGYRAGELAEWYPGDEYVDWVGISYFLHLDEKPRVATEHEPRQPYRIIEEVLRFARLHGKPVMIAEASPQGYDLATGTHGNIAPVWDGPQGGDRVPLTPEQIWVGWYAPLFELMEANADVIRALAYINCHWDVQDLWDAPYEQGYWGDSRLQVNPYLAERFSAAIEAWRSGP